MAVNSFDEALALIKDPDKAKIFREVADEYSDIKGGWLRQSDYSREMNRMKDREKQIETDIRQLEGWKQWRTDHWVDLEDGRGKTKEQIEVETKLEELNSELDTLKTAQEAGMTFDEVSQWIDKELPKRGVVTKDYLDKEVRPSLVDRKFYDEDTNKRITAVANGLEYLVEETTPLLLKHDKEFGEIFKPRELVIYMNERGLKNVEEAYNQWVSPKRNEIQTKKHAEEIAAAKQAGKEEALKEKGMAIGGKNPVDQGAPVTSHLVARLRPTLEGAEKNPIPEDMELGKGSVASMVAQLYRKDAAEGTVLKAS